MTGWRQRAACKDAPPDLFFPIASAAHTDQVSEARAYCDRCEVTRECSRLAAALEASGIRVHGVWAGTTEVQRDALRAQARAMQKAVAAR